MSELHQQRDLGAYKVGGEIGRGSFANVYKGKHQASGAPVAIKSVLRARLNKRLLESLDHEISILKRITHPHIVSLIDFQQTNSHFYLIMEYCSLGDLSFFFRKRKELINSHPLIASLFQRYPPAPDNGLHEDLARHFLKQLASALEFLRENDLVHRDIKPQNLLLCPPKKTEQEAKAAGYKALWELPVLKLADFGFARILPSTSMAETLCGSPLYMAPEILRLEKYNHKADLWSVGAVLYEMVAGRPPFHAATHTDLLAQITKSQDVIEFPANNTSSQEIKRLIRALLKQDPTQRISYEEFLQDPVIVNDIHSPTRPLDRSFVDEHLYVSEYIQLGPTNPLNLADIDKKQQKQRLLNQQKNTDQSNPSSNNNNNTTPINKKYNNQPMHNNKQKYKNTHQTNTHAITSSNNTNTKQSTEHESSSSSSSSSYELKDITNKPMNLHVDTKQPSPSPPTPPHSMPKSSKVSRNDSINDGNTKSNSSGYPQSPLSYGSRKMMEHSPSPGTSWLTQYQGKHSISPSSPKRGSVGGRKSNNSNNNNNGFGSIDESSNDPFNKPLESEYVVVEKRTVEVNSFADELVHSPVERRQSSGNSQATLTQQQQQQQTSARNRRNSYARSSVNSQNYSGTSGIGISIAGRCHRNSSGSETSGSSVPAQSSSIPERRYSIVHGSSPSNALTRALSMASARLFGTKISDTGDTTSTTPPKFAQRVVPPTVDSEEKRLIRHLDSLTTKAKAINMFAEVKYTQIIPLDEADSNRDLSPDAMVIVAREALALYLKTLSLLSKVMNEASVWWKSRSSTENMSPSSKLIEMVQWIRDKFNESLEKAEYVKEQINKYSSLSSEAVVASGRNITAEKLVFDHAMEMAHSAAVCEMSNEDLEDCQLSYATAIWMLEALLESTDDDSEPLKEADRNLVTGLIDSLSGRLTTVRKKISQQALQYISFNSPSSPSLKEEGVVNNNNNSVLNQNGQSSTTTTSSSSSTVQGTTTSTP